MLQRTATHCNTPGQEGWRHTLQHCNALQTPQRSAMQCNILQHTLLVASETHTATHYNTLQHTATRYITQQHTAIHNNTLQHTKRTVSHTNTHHHTAAHSNTPGREGARPSSKKRASSWLSRVKCLSPSKTYIVHVTEHVIVQIFV